jgi:hypothetical protein
VAAWRQWLQRQLGGGDSEGSFAVAAAWQQRRRQHGNGSGGSSLAAVAAAAAWRRWQQLGSVIGHGLMLLFSIAKWCDSLNSQSPVYDGDRLTPLDLSNLLPQGTDLDPDEWLTLHKSIPAFPHKNASASSNRRSFGSKRYFQDMYQIQHIWNSHVLASNARFVRCPWYLEKDPFDQTC